MEAIRTLKVPLINSVGCIKGEIHNIVNIMRLTSKWANAARFSREVLNTDASNMLHSFRTLHEQLEGVYDVREVDCVLYLQPFLDVVASQSTSGAITSAALSSLYKFLSYGFLATDCPRAREGVNLVARCIPSCIFEETDSESDEVVLMKLLELATLCIQCDASNLLSVRNTWNVYETCYMIGSDKRASKLLKSKAESALAHLTLSLFGKANECDLSSLPNMPDAPSTTQIEQYVTPTTNSSDVNILVKEQQGASEYVQRAWGADVLLDYGIPAILARIMSLCSGLMQVDENTKDTVVLALKLVNIALEAAGAALSKLDPVVAFLKGEMCRNLLKTSHSQDLEILSLSLRVVFNLFSSIKDHMKIQLEVFLASVHLRLLHSPAASAEMKELVLESLLEFCREPAMVHDLYINYDCDVRCTNLFHAIMAELCQQAIPSMATAATPKVPTQSFRNPTAHKGEEWLPEHLQGSLKSIAKKRKRAREGGMRSRANSESGSESSTTSHPPLVAVNILNRLALESLLAVQHSIAKRCVTDYPAATLPSLAAKHSQTKHFPYTRAITAGHLGLVDMNVDSEEEPWERGDQSPKADRKNDKSDFDDCDFLAMARARTAEVLRQRRIKKQRMALAAEKFNSAPAKTQWLNYAQELGLLAGTPDAPPEPAAVAQFLRNTPGLEKSGIGEFLSKGPQDKYPFNAAVLKEYVDTFDFTSMKFDEALRTFLSHFRLPGEAQCIDRFMEAFAKRLIEQCGTGTPFANSDAAFILAFSTIMLNTDLHNKQIPDSRRMKVEEFIRNNRGINAGQDLPKEFLEDLYYRIKNDQLQVNKDISEVVAMDDADFSRVEHSLFDSKTQVTAASFTPTHTARKHLFPAGIHEKDMFLLFSEELLLTMLKVWTVSEDGLLLIKILEGIQDYARICSHFGMEENLNVLLQLLIAQTIYAVDRTGVGPEISSASHGCDIQSVSSLTTHQLDTLLTSLESSKNVGFIPDTSEIFSCGIQLETIVKAKCHLLLYSVFLLVSVAATSVTDAWRDVVALLVYLRQAGVLPSSLTELDDFADARGEPLANSIFKQQCFISELHSKLLGHADAMKQVDRRNSSTTLLNSLRWWSSGTQLGSISRPQSSTSLDGQAFHISSVNTRAQSTSITGVDDVFMFDDDSYIYQHKELNQSLPVKQVRKLLIECTERCRIDHLLFHRMKEVQLSAICILIDSILEYVVSTEETDAEPKLCYQSEADGVYAVEWVSRIILANRSKAINLWPHLHSVLDYVLDSRATYACRHTPYLVERCAITVLRAAIHMLDVPALSDRVWQSLRMLRCIPVDIAQYVSDRLGAGLLSLIRVTPQRAATTEEQWYLLFSLLGAAASGRQGRPFVWEAISYLIDNNLVSDSNFVPARLLVLRFLHGVFPGEGEEDDYSRGKDTDSMLLEDASATTRVPNPWLTGSLVLTFRLMLMVLKGLNTRVVRENDRDAALSDDVSGMLQTASSSRPLWRPLDVPGSELNIRVSPELGEVVVELQHSEEQAIALYTDSIKVFGEFTGAWPTEVSKHACYLLQTLLRAGAQVGFQPHVWTAVLHILLTTLPMNIESAPSRVSGYSRQELLHVCMRCCEVAFDTFSEHFKDILMLDDFQSVFLRLLSVLATNFVASEPRTEANTHCFEMILVLLKRLQHGPTYLLYAEKCHTRALRLVHVHTRSQQTPGESTGVSTQIGVDTGCFRGSSHEGTGADTSEMHVTKGPDVPVMFDRAEADRRRLELVRLTWRVLDSMSPGIRNKCMSGNPELCVSSPIAAASASSRAASASGKELSNVIPSKSEGSDGGEEGAREWDVRSIVRSLLERKAQTV